MKKKLSPRIRLTALGLCAVFILSTLSGCAKGAPESAVTPEATPDGFQAVTAVYPGPTAEKMNSQEFIESDAHWDWWDAY
ncbi:MAG: hypothetical protein IKS06_06825, partial [Lachnospiraceae bacterium]|nr:hypothetical protein [Lachnospiraceae bacterium]